MSKDSTKTFLCLLLFVYFCQLKHSRYSIHVLQTEKGRDLQLTGQTSFALHVLNIQEWEMYHLLNKCAKQVFVLLTTYLSLTTR